MTWRVDPHRSVTSHGFTLEVLPVSGPLEQVLSLRGDRGRYGAVMLEVYGARSGRVQ